MAKIKKLISMTLLSTAFITALPVGANAAWKQDDNGWGYTEGNSWVSGWRNIDGTWYYFGPESGYMAEKTTIDGYYVNENGAWINDFDFNISASQAEELVKNQYQYITSYRTIDGPYVDTCGFDDYKWIVRVYYDNAYKTTNIGWYYVDKNTGIVTSMF